MSDETLHGVVRPGPPPADADRPEVIIRDERGDVRQAAIRLEDGTLVEVTAPDLERGPFLIQPDPWAEDLAVFKLHWRTRDAFRAQLLDPLNLTRITGT